MPRRRSAWSCAPGGQAWLSRIAPPDPKPAERFLFGVTMLIVCSASCPSAEGHRFVVVFPFFGSSYGLFALAKPLPLLVRRRHASTTIAPPLQRAARMSQRCCSGVRPM